MSCNLSITYDRVGQATAREPHAAISLVSCGSCNHIDMYVSYICLLHLNAVRYFLVRGRCGVILMCPMRLIWLFVPSQ